MNAEYKKLKGKVLFFGKNEGHDDYTLNLELTGAKKTALGLYPSASFPTLTLADTEKIRFYEDA